MTYGNRINTLIDNPLLGKEAIISTDNLEKQNKSNSAGTALWGVQAYSSSRPLYFDLLDMYNLLRKNALHDVNGSLLAFKEFSHIKFYSYAINLHDGNMLMQRKRGSVFEKTNIETYLKNKCLQLKVPVQMNSYSLKDNVQFEVEDDVLKVLQ